VADEVEAVKAEAIAFLHAALVRGSGVDDALRRAFYRNPEFCVLLFVGSVQRRYGNDSDVRSITALTARITATRVGDPLGFPAREAELLMRVSLGETDLWPELDWAKLNYLEIFIAVLQEVFGEWQPTASEVEDLIHLIQSAAAHAPELAGDLAPGMSLATHDWFKMGMHQSPFLSMASNIAADDGPRSGPDNAAEDDDRQADSSHQTGGDIQLTAEQPNDDRRLADCDSAIARDPGNASLIADRGLAYNAQGRYEEALTDYNRAVQLDPTDASVLAGRASTFNLMGRHD
jgi:tetratricopeptide (TPR) repeat protein